MSGPREGLRRVLLYAWAIISRPFVSLSSASWLERSRILVIRPDHLGDLLFSTPALRLLRAAFPTAHIAALVGPWGEDVARRNPALDEILTCEFPGFARQPKGSLLAPYRLLQREARRLRSFDLAIVLRFDHWWGALLAYTACIPRRWGYDIPECRPFLTRPVPYVAGYHEVEQNLRLIEAGCQAEGMPCPTAGIDTALSFSISEEERAFADDYLARHGLAGGSPLVAIHPGAGAAVKLWPAERYAQVADALAERWDAVIILTGSRGELGLAWAVAAAMRADPLVAAGETTLGQLAALLMRCDLVIGSDSGPLHLAAAVGAPTIHLYGPANPALFGPWAPGKEAAHRAIVSPMACVPCNRLDYTAADLAKHPCMKEITVAEVLKAAEELLQLRARGL